MTIRMLLIADASPVARAMLCKAVRITCGAAFDVREAANATDALACVSQHPNMVVLTEWHWPDMSPQEFIEQMANDRLLDTAHVIVVTAQHSPALRAPLEELGVRGFLPKPWQPLQLRALLQPLVEG